MRQLMIVLIVCAACMEVIQAKKDKKAGIFMLKVKGKGMQNMYANNNYGGGGYGGGYGGQSSYGGGGYSSGYGASYGGGGYGGYGLGGYQGGYGAGQPPVIPIYYPVLVPSYHHQPSPHVDGYAESAMAYGQHAGRNIGINIYPVQHTGYQGSSYGEGFGLPHAYGNIFGSGLGSSYGGGYGSSYGGAPGNNYGAGGGSSYSSGGY